MACIIWTGTNEPADLISKLFANEEIEAKGKASEIRSIILIIFYKKRFESNPFQK